LLASGAPRSLLAARRATLTADLGEDSRLDAVVTFPDARTAARGRDVAQLGLAFLKVGLNSVEEELIESLGGEAKVKDSKILKLFDSARQAIDDARLKTEDGAVKLSMHLKVDTAIVKAVVTETLPAIQEAANRARATNNLRQIGIALHAHNDAFGKLPTATIYSADGTKPLYSWRVALLPFLEQEALYNALKRDEPWDSEHNKKVLKDVKMPGVFALPGVPAKEGHTFLQVFTGPDTTFDGKKQMTIQGIADGSSNTIAVVEAAESVHWAAPGDDIPYSAKVSPLKQLGNHYGKGTLAVLFDGSFRTISPKMTEKTIRAAITPNGGEILGSDW